MGFYISPQVAVIERDLSAYVPGIATSIACYVGNFPEGPVNQRTLVTSERNLAELFGNPTDTNYEDFYSCEGYLRKGRKLYVTRAVDKAVAKNASIGISPTTVTSSGPSADYIQFESEANIFNSSGTDYLPVYNVNDNLRISAKYPGLYGNTDIKVAVINSSDWYSLPISGSATLSGYEQYVDNPPVSGATDEFVVLVSVKGSDGTFNVVETFTVSSTPSKKDGNGDTFFVENKINKKSNYILAFWNTGLTTAPVSFPETALSGGLDGNPSAGDIILGYDLYKNPEDLDINIVIGGGNTSVSVANKIISLCESRMDCVGILDFPKSEVVGVANISTAINNILTYRKTTLNPNTNYVALYANWLQIYDKYNDKKRWIPCGGYVAGIYAGTDRVAEPWFAPAGMIRGRLTGVDKIAISPDLGFRDILYKNGINPIVSFKGEGIYIWGQKTLQSRPSAFDRINVRRLFIVLEKAIATAAKQFVFEQNDEFTQKLLKNVINPFLADVKGRRGIVDYIVDTSSAVNTPERIDRNELWVDIYIAPTKAAEYLILRFNATRTGVNFNELIG